ncbi:phospholipase a-2-activating protein [Malassezia pachydermatis]|uniref:Phospholipase a-2-activating protein n=1 Tax=Malassezia pachydermatis TaxID=77020 RepID=A0A0M8MLU5_9BASI|nr:phospholipase a-2-activating protein [Malassezia pachydermatis]KOS15096.1 phospholipase a-2-activating protein [Malassezia pachydermatis]
MPAPFVLASRLAAHTGDVRALASYTYNDGTTLLLAGSRDQTASFLDHGSGFVNAVAFFHDGSSLYALLAGQDTLIYAFPVHYDAGRVHVPSTPHYSLVGHTANVCTLRSYGSEYFVSGSWDSTIKVWKHWTCVATLTGHTQSVWSVWPVDEDRLLSASADKSVCLWSIGEPTEPLKAWSQATQAVRDVMVLSSSHIVAAGNDGHIRHWDMASLAVETIATLPAFVYALAPLSATSFASSGEDRCVRIWSGHALEQLLPIPAVSVWCVCALSNGDVACGASDGYIYVFTRDPARASSGDDCATYTKDVATQALTSADVDGVRAIDAGPETTPTTDGTTEGEACLVHHGSQTLRFQWSTGLRQWVQTGMVSESAKPSQKTVYEGKEYDYVFDVDIADGVPPLKLPYNVHDNPFVAASQFLEKNELPASFLDQVVRFLEKNTQGVQVDTAQAAPVDPYTGATRYTPASAAATPTPTPVSASLSVLPQTAYQAFTNAQLSLAHTKALELSTSVPGATLSDEDKAALASLITDLEQGQGIVHVDVLHHLLSTWPIAARFPLLDLLRVAASRACSLPFETLITDALVGAEWDALEASTDAKVASMNAMLALRTLANGFVAPNGPATMQALALEALATLQQPPWSVLQRPGRTALSTVALNYSILAVQAPSFEQAGLLCDLLTDVR